MAHTVDARADEAVRRAAGDVSSRGRFLVLVCDQRRVCHADGRDSRRRRQLPFITLSERGEYRAKVGDDHGGVDETMSVKCDKARSRVKCWAVQLRSEMSQWRVLHV